RREQTGLCRGLGRWPRIQPALLEHGPMAIDINWEQALLERGLSRRALRAGAAYAGPGAGSEPAKASELEPILFTAGIPDAGARPIDGLAAASERILREPGGLALQYGGAQGFAGLRDWLASHWSRLDGVPLTAANFTLTNGSAGALQNL